MRPYGWAGLLMLLASELCLVLKIEPFYSWFYCFAWWSYILLADNLLFTLRGASLLTTRKRELRAMIPLSVFIWLLFEGYNLFIRNWAYDGMPRQIWLRWLGYFVAFATVLPGVFTTSDLVDALLFGHRTGSAASEFDLLREKPLSRPSVMIFVLGFVLTVAPLLWPRYFFPTVWLGPDFLLDPLLERFGVRSLSLSIASGDRRRVWSLILGGLTCGLLWEFWNFWAASKWIYTVPFFSEWRVFEMPLLGFLGFPPFALECWVLYHLLTSILRQRKSVPAQAAFWIVVFSISLAIFWGIDQHTVVRFSVHAWRPLPWVFA
jgi:hypothetical protein